MAAIEKLLVQIFDRKSQIIQQLNHQKQHYRQRLLSKLLIDGISPPPFLLTDDFLPSSLDLTELNKEELISGLLLPRPGPLVSHPSGPCFLFDKPVGGAANNISSKPDVTCDVKCSSSDGINEDELVVVPPDRVYGSEDMVGVALPSQVDVSNNDGLVETSNYVHMSIEDQADTRLLNAFKSEASLGRIQRSRSRQKALELRNSAKTNGKSRLGMENEADISYRTNLCYDEQYGGFQKSLELAEPLALPPDTCVNEAIVIGNNLNKERIADDCGDSLTQSKDSKEIEGSEDSQIKKNSVCSGPFTRSRSCSKQPLGIPSGSKTYSSNEHLDVLSESLKSKEPYRFSAETCSKEQVMIKNFLDEERTIDTIGASLINSTAIEGKVAEMGGNHKSEECSKAYGGRITRSRSSCRQHIGGSIPLYSKSNEVCIGQMTRSKSGKTRQASNDDLQNARCSSHCNQPIDAFGNSKAESTQIRSDEAKELGTGNERSRSRKELSVKPKQLDFDEVDERILGGIPNSISTTISQSEENMLADFNVSYAMDGSWPCCKRRKMECQNFNKSASPIFRVNSFCVVNDKEANKSSGGEKENIPCMSRNLTNSHPVGVSLSSCAQEIDQNVSSSHTKEDMPTPLVQCEKDEDNLGRTVMSSTCEPQHISELDVSNVNPIIIAELSESLSEDGKENSYAPSAAFCDGRVSDGLLKNQDLGDISTSMKLMDMGVDQNQFSLRVDERKLSIRSPFMEHMDVAEASQSVPEFKCFVVGENTAGLPNSTIKLATEDFSFLSNIMDRSSLSEKICNSATSSTPLSPFPSACKVYLAPGIYSSVPNGLLENVDRRSNLLPTGNALFGKSHSDIFPFAGSQCGWDMKKHFLSPVGNGFEVITSKSRDSDKPGSSNLELTCFPIMEDPESSEEVVNDAANTGVERTDSTLKSSANMEPQNDNTMASNNATNRENSESVSSDVKQTDSSISGDKELLSDVTLHHENSLAHDPSVLKYSLGSVSTEIGTHKIHSTVKKSGLDQRRSRQTGLGKENKVFSIGTISRKKLEKTHSSRFSKPQLSAKFKLRSRGQSMSVNKQKPNNIVSNMKSFLPLVQQKQAAAVVPEKRDVKVKALQAAEAAKRAAEKRENERKQKKEAMKLERARVEQEQLREMELKKKLKEEERKKKEAQKAAKKRQREEEERQEKERKKKRIEDARLQHKQLEEKLHAWRGESRFGSEHERPHQRKDCNDRPAKQVNSGHEGYDTNNSVAVGNDRKEADDRLATAIDNKMSTGSSATEKAGNIDITESSTPNFVKDKMTMNQNHVQESYDISPYQCSDDEDDEEDEIPNNKFIPTWASKNNLALALSSLQHIDPEEIFPPGSFCSLDEVLLPRRLAQK